MSNVIEFRRGKARGETARMAGARQESGAGSIVLTTRPGEDESSMQVTGVYEQRLQFGVFTMVKALNAMVEHLAASGDVGHYSAGPISEPLPIPTRRLPKRLRESTGFGELR